MTIKNKKLIQMIATKYHMEKKEIGVKLLSNEFYFFSTYVKSFVSPFLCMNMYVNIFKIGKVLRVEEAT